MQNGLKVSPIGWNEAQEILMPLYEQRAHWIVVAHVEAMPLIQAIEQKYYCGSRNADFTIVAGSFRGQMYTITAAKKRWMQGYQIASLLRQMVAYKVSDAEMRRRDFLITARDALLQDAFDLAATVFRPQASGDLAMES